MKTRHLIPKLILTLCGICAATAVYGQTTYTWTGAGDAFNIANAANWTPTGGPPCGASQDTAQWDGMTTTNLIIGQTSSFAYNCYGYGSQGINLGLTANQTNSVQLISPSGKSSGFGLNNITIDSGAGPLIFGDTSANNLLVYARPAGGDHLFVNNSTNPATINPSVEWQAGGGNGYTYDFSGTGDWIVNSYLMPDNSAFSAMYVYVEGPGAVYWSAGKTGAYNPNTPLTEVDVNGGMLVIKTSGLFTGSGNQTIGLGGTFVYDAPSQAQTLTGTINGPGTLQVNNGTLTLSGQSGYTGTTLLTGGELIVNSAETPGTSGPLGVGGTITFSGGTLGLSVNNVFDYSSRFDTNANQAYSIDTAGQNVTFSNELASVGGTLTKLGPGTLALAGTNTYTGNTTVSVGKLVFQGPMTGTGNITVDVGAALGVTGNGTQVKPATLTVGTTGGATLEFNNISSTTTAPLAPGTVSAVGTITINVNGGAFTAGQSYPLLTWTSGSAPAVNLGLLIGATGSLSTNGNTIQVNIAALSLFWTGSNNGNWDTTTPNNWIFNGSPVTYSDPSPVVFDDSAPGATNVTLVGVVQPSNVTINNNSKPYTITSSAGNDIAGSGSFIKAGSGTLTLSGGANTYTGVSALIDGTLSVGALANGGSASDLGAASSSAANLIFNGGQLQYTGSAASIDRLFTLGTAGGTIDASGSGALSLNNAGAVGLSGTGPRVLTLTGTSTDNNTLAASLADNGAPTALTKNGVGTWVLAGTNTYSGGTTVNGGELQVGAGGASGSLGSGDIVNSASLDFNLTSTLTVSGAISGTGSVTNDGSGTVVLAANNTYTGGTTVNAGTLQVGNGGATGMLDPGSLIVDNGTLIFNGTGDQTLQGGISGSGQLIKRGPGLLVLRGGGIYNYNGGTTIDPGAVLQIFSGNEGTFSGVGTITNNGTLIVVRQDNGVAGITNNIIGTGMLVKDSNNANNGDVTLMGTNTYTGGTVINGGYIILGDNTTPGAGTIIGDVTMTNFSLLSGQASQSELIFNHPAGDDLTFSGNITGAGLVVQQGSDTVTLTGTNTYSAGTTINVGTLQVGNGGTSGSIGTGAVTDNGVLVFNRSDDLTFGGDITGSGAVVQQGAGSLTLTSTNLGNYTGTMTASNGTLVVTGGSMGGVLDVNGGTVAPAAAGALGTLNVGGMNISSGTVLVALNKALSPSNSVFSSTSSIFSSGGTLKLVNVGPALTVGDRFVIFNQPVGGGTAMTIASTGFTVTNNLAVDGSVTVTAVTVLPRQTITTTVSAGQLTLSWQNAGLHLQVQTNSLSVGLSNNWVTIPGTDAGTNYTAPLNNTNGCVFYRLIQ